MSKEIKIERINSQHFKINGKGVWQNTEGEWIAPYNELTSKEWEAFNDHLKQFE